VIGVFSRIRREDAAKTLGRRVSSFHSTIFDRVSSLSSRKRGRSISGGSIWSGMEDRRSCRVTGAGVDHPPGRRRQRRHSTLVAFFEGPDVSSRASPRLGSRRRPQRSEAIETCHDSGGAEGTLRRPGCLIVFVEPCLERTALEHARHRRRDGGEPTLRDQGTIGPVKRPGHSPGGSPARGQHESRVRSPVNSGHPRSSVAPGLGRCAPPGSGSSVGSSRADDVARIHNLGPNDAEPARKRGRPEEVLDHGHASPEPHL
jgi:hypothetical protein